MLEHELQNRIRAELSRYGTFFRSNVGTAWTGDDIVKLDGGGILIPKARPFNTGLPPGFSDIIGVVPIFITHDLIGRTLGVFTAIEVKRPGGKGPTDDQKQFLSVMNGRGALTGVARSVEDAVRIVKAWEYHGDV